MIARKTFDLPDQVREPGSVSWCKTVKINSIFGERLFDRFLSQAFNHTQADKEVKNFYPNDSLFRVFTSANLIAFLQEITGYSEHLK